MAHTMVCLSLSLASQYLSLLERLTMRKFTNSDCHTWIHHVRLDHIECHFTYDLDGVGCHCVRFMFNSYSDEQNFYCNGEHPVFFMKVLTKHVGKHLFTFIHDKNTYSYVPRLLWTSIKVQKGHTKVNAKLVWDFGVENTSLQAWINQCNLWTFIMLTRYPGGCTAHMDGRSLK